MPFTTRDQLKVAVINKARRTDTEQFFDDALAMAELRLSHDLEAWSGESSATVSFLANASEITLPANCLSLISASVVGSSKPEIEIISPQKRLEIIARPDGWPYARASIEENKIKFAAPFKLAGSVALLYKSTVAPLVAPNDTNWILQRHYNLYVYAALIELYIDWGVADRLSTVTTAYSAALSQANKQQVYKGTNAFAEIANVV